jgi:hypothetical protein
VRTRVFRILGPLGLLLASLAVALLIAELGARALGRRPFRIDRFEIEVEPGGRYQGLDPLLGYRHLPGQFRITFDQRDTWTATHRPDTLRVTRAEDAPPLPAGAPGIWIFGCSFVHGWGLDDADTFPWKVQALLPDHDVRNFGVGGYGTVQSLLQFRGAVRTDAPPRIAVLGYASFHDERNTRLRQWRKANMAYDRFGPTSQPYARLTRGGGIEVRSQKNSPRDFWLSRHSALANTFDLAYSRLEDRRVQSREVSLRLIAEFAREVEASGARFVLAGIERGTPTRSALARARELGIATTDISADLSRPGFAIRFDGHPSALATEVFARRLVSYLRNSGALGAP